MSVFCSCKMFNDIEFRANDNKTASMSFSKTQNIKPYSAGGNNRKPLPLEPDQLQTPGHLARLCSNGYSTSHFLSHVPVNDNGKFLFQKKEQVSFTISKSFWEINVAFFHVRRSAN